MGLLIFNFQCPIAPNSTKNLPKCSFIIMYSLEFRSLFFENSYLAYFLQLYADISFYRKANKSVMI